MYIYIYTCICVCLFQKYTWMLFSQKLPSLKQYNWHHCFCVARRRCFFLPPPFTLKFNRAMGKALWWVPKKGNLNSVEPAVWVGLFLKLFQIEDHIWVSTEISTVLASLFHPNMSKHVQVLRRECKRHLERLSQCHVHSMFCANATKKHKKTHNGRELFLQWFI